MKPKERARLLADLDDKTIEAILKAWDLWRRDDQAPPDGDWLEVEIKSDMLFASGSAAPRPEAVAAVTRVAEVLRVWRDIEG